MNMQFPNSQLKLREAKKDSDYWENECIIWPSSEWLQSTCRRKWSLANK